MGLAGGPRAQCILAMQIKGPTSVNWPGPARARYERQKRPHDSLRTAITNSAAEICGFASLFSSEQWIVRERI